MQPQVAFRQHEFQPPQSTISLSETSLQSSYSPSRSQTPSIKEEPGEEKKPTKKRKSWGQELPTPKTNLPPRYDLRRILRQPENANDLTRKRAKTDDEKEQRRIERVLRNRAAAQSSRERKRQEVEKLEGEKATIEQQNQYLKDRLLAAEHEKFLLIQKLAKATAKLSSLEGSSTSSLAASPEPESDTFDQVKIKQEIDDTIYSLATPQTFSSPSTMTYSPSQSPSQPSLSFDDSSLATSPDMTQHPAAMLCDLQCQSVEAPRQVRSPQPTAAATAIPSSSATMTTAISLILASTVYSQLMTPLYQILTTITNTRHPSRKQITDSLTSWASTRQTSPSAPPTSPLTQWLISILSSQQAMTTKSTSNLATTASTQARLTRRLRSLHSLFLSSPPLARPLKDATGRTLRGETSNATSRHQGVLRRSRDSRMRKGLSGNGGLVSSVRSRRGERRGVRTVTITNTLRRSSDHRTRWR